MRALAAEAIGTFALVLAGTGAIVVNARTGGALGIVGVALTFGLVVMAMIYATGHISGAHFNPAVTLGFAVARHFPLKLVLPYWGAQLMGAILASVTVLFLIGSEGGLGTTHPSIASLPALLLEGILTFLLMFVIMAVATDTRAVGEAAAIAIGGTIALEALFAGFLTGASMNPARSLAPALVSLDFADLPIYLVGPIIGAMLGSIAYRWTRGQPQA